MFGQVHFVFHYMPYNFNWLVIIKMAHVIYLKFTCNMTCSVYHYSQFQLVQWKFLPVTTMMFVKSYLEQNKKKSCNWFVLSLMWTDQLKNNERVAPLPPRGSLLPHNALIRRKKSLEFALWFHIFSEISLSVAAYTFLVTCIIFMHSLRLTHAFLYTCDNLSI